MFASIGQARAAQSILPTLQKIGIDIQLKLPSDRIALSQQLYRLRAAHKQLEEIEDEILAYYAITHRPSTRSLYRKLLKVVRQMLRSVDNLTHLAEEFPVDPIGTVACLESTTRKTRWPRNLEILQDSLKHRPSRHTA
jgi:hypothetical protein